MNRSFIYGMLAAISICAAPSIFALTFSTNVEGKNSKFSQCAWESDPHINKVPLRGKPGRRDNVYIRTYGKDFEIDMPVEVKSIAFLYDTNTKMENKKLVTTRGDMGFESSGGAGTNNVLKAKKSEFIINGSLRFYLWEKCQGMGSSALQMEDSKMMLNGNILYSVPALYLKATKNRSGAEISLTGDSFIKSKGEILLDSLLAENPNLHFRFVFNEKDGKIPFISVESANLEGAEIHINIKNKLKKGLYPIIDCNKKESKGKPRLITINGAKVSLGTISAVNGQDITLKIDSADGKKKIDYVLEVK